MGTGDQQADDGGGGGLQADGPTIKNLMDLKECVEDSPSFRSQLSNHEQEVGSLEVKLDKVVQSCDRMVSSGIAYMEECRTFSNSVKELSSHFEKGGSVSGTLRRFHEILTELQSYYSILFDQAQRSVQSSLRSFLSGELRKVKDAKKSFDKVSDELNTAIHRNAHTPRSRPVEAEEASITLSTVQTQFSHHSIEYAYQLNMVKAGKGHQILDNLLAFMRAQFTFFHQGYDLLREYDPFMRQVASEVDKMSKEADVVIHEMDSRHNLVTPQHLPNGSPNEPLSLMDNPSLPIEMSGYLFKRASNAFKSWSRRWFILRENRMVYQSESKAEEFAVAEDLRICTVKYAGDLERRFCFEVVTPIRSCMLQADSEALRKKWVAHLEAGIARALRISASNKKSEDMEEFRKRSATVSKGTPIDILRESPGLGGQGKRSDTANSDYSLGLDFLDVPGNDKCADCGSKKPKWASINLGIILCIECSGIHRSLGVHISKVRSVTLDDWDTELQKIMCALGNARVNGIYEFEVPNHVKKPNPQSSRLVRESFIRAKYVQHAFVHPHPNFERPEIPVPPPSFPDLLTPSKSPLTASLGSSSPRSPIGKRSFSPSVKRRSPRSLSGSLRLPYRPASTSSSINPSDRSTPIDSEDDLPSRADFSATVDPSSSSMYLLAENLKKLEKSGKLKNWGNFNLGDKLGDTIKSAKKSSKKITGYALSKLGGQGAILRRGKKSKSKEGAREVHSDTEEGDDLLTSSTPLLHSMSASTHNLSIDLVPPPKPPRTFKTKFLGQTQHEKEEKEDDLLKMCEDEFSTDVLNALKQVSSVIDRGGEGAERDGEHEGEDDDLPYNSDTKVMANGLLSSEKLELGTSLVKRSESSPQLTVSLTPADELESRSSPDLLWKPSRAIGLQPIAEANSEVVDTTDGDKMVRLVSSVPLRRKMCPPAPTTFLPQSHLATCDAKASAMTEDDDEDLKKFMDDSNSRADKRLSMMSTTSAEFFSAASSEANSAAASPDFLRHGILTPPPGAPVTIISVEDGEGARVMSSMSAEEEYFSTPPSSPNPVNQPDEMDVGQPDEADVGQPDETDVGQPDETDVGQPDETDVGQPDETEVKQTDKTEVEQEDKKGEDKMVAADEIDLNEPVVNTVTELTGTTNTVTKTTAALTKEDGGETVNTTTVKRDGRKRSLTVSESMTFTVNVTGGNSRGMIKTMSKDDNFQTEYHHVFESNDTTDSSGTLAVSFSTQDLADIFNGARSGLPEVTFDPLKEEPSVTKTGTEVVKGDEEREEKGEGESASVADRSASPTCSSVGGSTSPEIIEPVIIPDDITPDTFLYSSVMVNDFPGVLCAIAHGGNTNYTNKEEESKTPILLAAEANNSVMVEYLYQNGAKLTAADDHGQTLLHYAVTKDDANMVMMLLRRGVMSDIKDSEGKDPMSLAVEKENGDIVTMLRMSAFKSQAQKGSDDRQSQYMEELASEFYRDIEVASLVDPERIKRKSTTSSIEDSSSSISRDSK